MEVISKMIMPRLLPLQLSAFEQQEREDESLNGPEYDLCGSFGNYSSVDEQKMRNEPSLEPHEKQPPLKYTSISPQIDLDRFSPLAFSDKWLAFGEREVPKTDVDLNLSSSDLLNRWASPGRLNNELMFPDSNVVDQRERGQNENQVFFSNNLFENVNDNDNETSSLLSDDSRNHKPIVTIRKRMTGFTPLKFLTSRPGRASVESEHSKKASFFKKPSPEDGVDLLGDWRESMSSGHLAFDVDVFETDDYVLEETEPPVWNMQGNGATNCFGEVPHIPEPEQRDDIGTQGMFLYDDCNQRIPHPDHTYYDSSYGASICLSFLESFTCQSDLIRHYHNFGKIEHHQPQRTTAARRRRKKISKKKKKKRLREQREGSHRASNFQCNLSTIVEHSDEDDDRDRSAFASGGVKRSFSLQSSSTGDVTVDSDEDMPYSDGFYNPREVVLVAARHGDWEIQEMQEI